jgi:MFS family permease
MTSLAKLQKHSDSTIINLGLIISLGNCCIGYTGVCLSSIEDILKQHNGLSDNKVHVSFIYCNKQFELWSYYRYYFSYISGALLYKKFEDHVGTLKAFALVDMLCLLFLSLQLVDLNVYYLVGGRFLYGIFMTMSLAMTPAFLNKMSKMFNPKIMGTLGSFNQLLIVFGIIVSYMLAYILPDKIDSQNISASIKWRIYIGFPIVFILIRLYAVLTRN